MKRSLILLLSILMLLCVFTPAAAAEGAASYIKIDNATTNLYSTADCADADELCVLPTSYYATYISEATNSYQVNFAGAVGYVKKSDVSAPAANSKLDVDYTNMTDKLTVSITAKETFQIKFYNVARNAELAIINSSSAVTYMGSFFDDVAEVQFYFVSYAGSTGYIKEAHTTFSPSTDIQAYSLPIDAPSATATSGANASATTPGNGGGSTNNIVRLLLIIGICIPAVIIIYLLFKPNKSEGGRYTSGDAPRKNRGNDDDDFYQ